MRKKDGEECLICYAIGFAELFEDKSCYFFGKIPDALNEIKGNTFRK